MTSVAWVRFATAVPMGQQVHELELRAALARELDAAWTISDCTLLPLRGRGRGRRIPLRLVWSLPYRFAALSGRVAYGRHDLVHRLDLRCPPAGAREVITIHDLPPLRFTDEGSLPRWAAESARTANAVICPSEFAAEEVRTLLGVERVRVIPNGIARDRQDAAPLSPEELEDLFLDTPLVLHAGGATDRKNLSVLAAAWAQVANAAPQASLVLCGPPDVRRDRSFHGLERVRYVGHRTPEFVARLMTTVSVVVVPSTYEGFGLPALEAMAAGTAVVAAARGALPEVCADGALLVEPTVEDLARGILEALAGGSSIDEVRARGRRRAAAFSWERTARETAALYEELVG